MSSFVASPSNEISTSGISGSNSSSIKLVQPKSNNNVVTEASFYNKQYLKQINDYRTQQLQNNNSISAATAQRQKQHSSPLKNINNNIPASSSSLPNSSISNSQSSASSQYSQHLNKVVNNNRPPNLTIQTLAQHRKMQQKTATGKIYFNLVLMMKGKRDF